MADLSFLIQKYQDELYCIYSRRRQLKNHEQLETIRSALQLPPCSTVCRNKTAQQLVILTETTLHNYKLINTQRLSNKQG